jgi:hypothetical protein
MLLSHGSSSWDAFRPLLSTLHASIKKAISMKSSSYKLDFLREIGSDFQEFLGRCVEVNWHPAKATVDLLLEFTIFVASENSSNKSTVAWLTNLYNELSSILRSFLDKFAGYPINTTVTSARDASSCVDVSLVTALTSYLLRLDRHICGNYPLMNVVWKTILRFARALSESADKSPVLPSFPAGRVALALLAHLTNHFKGLVQSIIDQQSGDVNVGAPTSTPPLTAFPTAFKLVRFFLAHLTNFLKQCGPLLLLPTLGGDSEGGAVLHGQGSGKRKFAQSDDSVHQLDSNVSFPCGMICNALSYLWLAVGIILFTCPIPLTD